MSSVIRRPVSRHHDKWRFNLFAHLIKHRYFDTDTRTLYRIDGSRRGGEVFNQAYVGNFLRKIATKQMIRCDQFYLSDRHGISIVVKGP